MTGRERALVEDAYSAIEDGDLDHSAELLRLALDDGPIRGDTRCPICRRWPGQQGWQSCPRDGECARLADAA